MQTHNHRLVVFTACFLLMGGAIVQAQTAGEAPLAGDSTEAAPSRQGTIWPSLMFSWLTGGPSDDLTHYMERYGVRKGFGSDLRRGFLADVTDLSFVYHDGRRDVLTADRRVSSLYNQRGSARWDNGQLRATGGYRLYRQAGSGLDYLYSPLLVAGGIDPAYTGGTVGYLGKFHDAVADPHFAATRTTYQVGVQTKPPLLNDKAVLGVSFHGLLRSGSSLDGLVMGGGEVLGTDADRRAKLRWHGYESTIDQSANELVLNAAVRPTGTVNIEYELGYERFRNNAKAITFGDIAAGAGIPVVATTAEAGAAGAIALASADVRAHFLADTDLLRQSIVASAGDHRFFVTAGGGWNRLTQETFTDQQRAEGYDQGDIGSAQLFVTMASHPWNTVSVEAYARRSSLERDIDVYSLNTRTTAMTLWTYGVEMDARLGEGRLRVTPGWTRRTATRDLEFTSIIQERTLYRKESASDELFLRTRWKMSPRITVRVTPSLLWADETALVTEPSQATKVNAAVSYANATGTTSLSGFYTIRTRRNDELFFTGSDGGTARQDRRGDFHQLGVAGTMLPGAATSLYWNYAWSRNEYRANFFGSTARRYDAAPVFHLRAAQTTSRLDSHSFTVGADVMPSGRIQYGVSYSITRSAGDVASGTVLSLLPQVDGRIENWYHSASVRAESDLRGSLKLGASYLFDYYSDDSYSIMTGGLHTLLVSLGYRFH